MPESTEISVSFFPKETAIETEEHFLLSLTDQGISCRNGLALVFRTVTRYYFVRERGQSSYLGNLNVILIIAFIIGAAVTKIVTVNYIWSFIGKGCLILNNHG